MGTLWALIKIILRRLDQDIFQMAKDAQIRRIFLNLSEASQLCSMSLLLIR